MIMFADYAIWIGSSLMAVYVAVLSWRRGIWRHFPVLTAYLLLNVFTNLGRFFVIKRLGLGVMYFFSDLILSAALYFVIVELYRIILPSRHWKLLRRCFLILFVLMALLSYATIQQSSVLRVDVLFLPTQQQPVLSIPRHDITFVGDHLFCVVFLGA